MVEGDTGMAGRVRDHRKLRIAVGQTIGISIVRSLPKMQNRQQLKDYSDFFFPLVE